MKGSKPTGYRISQYSKLKIQIVMTDRLRTDFKEHSSSCDYDYTKFKIYFVKISANKYK